MIDWGLSCICLVPLNTNILAFVIPITVLGLMSLKPLSTTTVAVPVSSPAVNYMHLNPLT